MSLIKKNKICIVGLGYVGIPLAMSFAKKNFQVTGFDIDKKKIDNLKKGIDVTNEAKKYGIQNLKKINFTADNTNLKNSNTFIITVPTPVDKNNIPDLTLLKKACILVGKNLNNGDLVILESTVYPLTTKNICIPILEKYSQLNHLNNKNRNYKKKYFLCGYSPERINPGDKNRNLKNITKVISGSSKVALSKIKFLYEKICDRIYIAETIEVAEAAKIIENTQRDVNIALINEFQKIFNLLNINVYNVLKAAKTKWNFLNFEPGFVGGHCIGVDPYYLAYCAKKIGYNPKLILAGRKINNEVVDDFYIKISNILKKNKIKQKDRILFVGASFKENCNDIRNSKVIELAEKLNKNYNILIYDPNVDYFYLKQNTTCKVLKKIDKKKYSSIILANKHNFIKEQGLEKFKNKLLKNGKILDIKNVFNLYDDLI